MQCVIFIGLQASGKSTYYLENFYTSHIRINLDMLNTRHREKTILSACLNAQQSVVIDNTNLTIEDRKRYIELCKDFDLEVHGYYFQSRIESSLERNRLRQGKAKIPDVAILGAYKRLQLPSLDEGFDKLFYVEITQQGFKTSDWTDEI